MLYSEPSIVARIAQSGCDVDPRDVRLLLPGPLLHSESLDLTAFTAPQRQPRQEAPSPPPPLQLPEQQLYHSPLTPPAKQEQDHLQQRPRPTSSQLRRARRARAKAARAAAGGVPPSPPLSPAPPPSPPQPFGAGDGCGPLPAAGLAAMNWCHVQAARRREPELDAAAVQSLVQMQLQAGAPILPPWYRGAAAQPQQSMRAA
ncbi:hypothetical protein Rsub_10887 [Raphidocelis subcapitata]|uniref:Uncharacterized protein n=1 Tax=Raphidocelis subcapitata TaxID=307507 RepID=A0A2V0PIG1_9CHLO|nr:hypothetical protein Rsub_10887 [Raphidocelis subcapitata]|eukprot:GBF97723.1 hypothetical protein Rsub_10887 [Raphidocelis subcapitata]